MSLVKPEFEKIEPPFGSSIVYKRFSKHVENVKPFWHYHPELEIVYVNGGSGRRQIGSHVSYYRNGDLIFIGSNLPHCGLTEKLTNNKRETVLQMSPDLLHQAFFDIAEMSFMSGLLERAKRGLVFHGESKRSIGKMIEEMNDMNYFERIVAMLNVFKAMDDAKDYTILNVQEFTLETSTKESEKINLIFNYVKEHYTKSISLEEIADVASMTVPAFCRYFKKMTRKTFTEFVNEYRIAHAAKLLHEKQISISEVCYDSGFNNLSHFNKLFKAFFGKTPSVYREELKFLMT
ncbi:MAG: helix-turn-helix domain-containing protein [Psychroflexus sp.]|nr:helix-turn-helix domain-containing protein [Psychroflexus sp.]